MTFFRAAVVFTCVLSAGACSDDGLSPFPPFYTLRTVATGSYSLVELNQAGHALLGTETGSLLWNGHELLEVPIPYATDLGSDDAVLGRDEDFRVLYWKAGALTELTGYGFPLGITDSGVAYYRADGAVHSWSGGDPEVVTGVPLKTTGVHPYWRPRIVGDDGVIYGTKFQCNFGCFDSAWAFVDGDTIGMDRALVIGEYMAAPANRYAAYRVGGGSGSSHVWHDGEIRSFYVARVTQVDVNSNGVVLVEGGLLVDGADSLDVRRRGFPARWTIGHGQLNDRGQLLLQVSNESDSAVVLLTPTWF